MFSPGSSSRIAAATVSPPMPESNTPMGCAFSGVESLLRAFGEGFRLSAFDFRPTSVRRWRDDQRRGVWIRGNAIVHGWRRIFAQLIAHVERRRQFAGK